MQKLICKHAPHVCAEFDFDEDELSDDTDSVLEFIGLHLHAIQQGVCDRLYINNFKVNAILMDQTCGFIDVHDILKTDHPERPYQRLENILAKNFEI